MKITATLLREHGACPNYLSLFECTFPDGMDVDEGTLIRAAEVGLDLDWAAREFLPSPLLAEFERQRAPLQAEYGRQLAPLWAEYGRQSALLGAGQRKPLWAEYERQRAPLWAEYERQRKPLLAEYDRQCALVLAKIVKDLP